MLVLILPFFFWVCFLKFMKYKSATQAWFPKKIKWKRHTFVLNYFINYYVIYWKSQCYCIILNCIIWKYDTKLYIWLCLIPFSLISMYMLLIWKSIVMNEYFTKMPVHKDLLTTQVSNLFFLNRWSLHTKAIIVMKENTLGLHTVFISNEFHSMDKSAADTRRAAVQAPLWKTPTCGMSAEFEGITIWEGPALYYKGS